MRRAPIVVSGTVVGLMGLLSFHSKASTLNLNSLTTGQSTTQPTTGALPTGRTTTTQNSTATTTPSTTQPNSSSTSSTSAPNSTATTTPSTTLPGSTSTSTTAPTTTTTAPPAVSKTAPGPVVNYFFGTVSISVTVSGKKITNIGIASLNDGGNPRSQQIDQYALPQLEQQALAANGVNIQGVSGATYTSQGFAQSLQGALSKVGL